MSDTINATAAESKFTPHPEGQFVAKCVDVIDLGEVVTDFPGTPKSLSKKCALVFRTGQQNPENNEVIDIAAEFTVSMGDKANLRKFLEAWRGKAYTPEQIKDGVPLHKLTGNWGLLTIEHKKSGKGRTYAKINSIAGVPALMLKHLPALDDYKDRADFWAEKKKANADAVRLYKAEIGATHEEPEVGGTDDMDDDLPF